MNSAIDKRILLERISEMIFDRHQKIDDAGIITDKVKAKSEGFIEALYQVENMINNFELTYRLID